MRPTEHRVIILLGPTASGKTTLSILLAQALQTEILSADSMQIYRGMDIGTAKPSKEELSKVLHHMIDIVEPSERFSVGQYIRMVIPIINRLHSQGKIPLVVGGTGLYIRAMTQGLFEVPDPPEGLRERLKEMASQDPQALYTELRRLDPDRAKQLNPSDLRRIIRALEVILTTGKPMSELQRDLTERLPYKFIKVGITRDRKELYRMIEQRVDEMFRQGLVEEVRRLLEKNPSEVALQAIGYKEVVAYIEGRATLEETIKAVKKATKAYAKRQFTWFKKEPSVQWVDITGLHKPEDIFRKVVQETRLKDIIWSISVQNTIKAQAVCLRNTINGQILK